jgi:hypothetical protein
MEVCVLSHIWHERALHYNHISVTQIKSILDRELDRI